MSVYYSATGEIALDETDTPHELFKPNNREDLRTAIQLLEFEDPSGVHTRINVNLNDWVVDDITDMSAIFQECTYFNKPLDKWKVSKVTNMFLMFTQCSNFNQELNTWDVSNVTKIGRAHV